MRDFLVLHYHSFSRKIQKYFSTGQITFEGLDFFLTVWKYTTINYDMLCTFKPIFRIIPLIFSLKWWLWKDEGVQMSMWPLLYKVRSSRVGHFYFSKITMSTVSSYIFIHEKCCFVLNSDCCKWLIHLDLWSNFWVVQTY